MPHTIHNRLHPIAHSRLTQQQQPHRHKSDDISTEVDWSTRLITSPNQSHSYHAYYNSLSTYVIIPPKLTRLRAHLHVQRKTQSAVIMRL